jgi:hypothetical protein
MTLPMLLLFRRRSKEFRETRSRVVLGIVALAIVLFTVQVLLSLWTWAVSKLSPDYQAVALLVFFPVAIAVVTVAVVIWGKRRNRRAPKN